MIILRLEWNRSQWIALFGPYFKLKLARGYGEIGLRVRLCIDDRRGRDAKDKCMNLCLEH